MERMNSFDATRMYANARRSITCTKAHVHRQSGVTDITARDLVLEINTHLLYNITEVQNLMATSALATLVHFAATRFLLFGNVHASFLFISTHAVPVQLFKVQEILARFSISIYFKSSAVFALDRMIVLVLVLVKQLLI